jgi:hypothetical protein
MSNPDEPTDLLDDASDARTFEVMDDRVSGKVAIPITQISSIGQTYTETWRLTRDEAITLHRKLGTYLFGCGVYHTDTAVSL